MLIILGVYIMALWAIFLKFKLVKWGWASGFASVLIGILILATFLGLFNYLTPTGRLTVAGRVVEVTPNVSGQIIAIPVKPNVPVKAGDVLFQIDPAPFKYKVKQLEASLAGARQQVEILKENYLQATANVTGLTAQVAFNAKRLADIETLAADEANTQFQAQDRRNAYETVLAQLNAAKAAKQSAKLAMDSEISGVNTTVAQIEAQLENANWELSQTTIRAPSKGYVTLIVLSVGDRALQAQGAMSFIVEEAITMVALFSQNGFQTVKEGAVVDIVFDNIPGRIYHARVVAIPKGIGQGEVAVSGTLAKTGAIGGATTFPAVISIPPSLALRLRLQSGPDVHPARIEPDEELRAAKKSVHALRNFSSIVSIRSACPRARSGDRRRRVGYGGRAFQHAAEFLSVEHAAGPFETGRYLCRSQFVT